MVYKNYMRESSLTIENISRLNDILLIEKLYACKNLGFKELLVNNGLFDIIKKKNIKRSDEIKEKLNKVYIRLVENYRDDMTIQLNIVYDQEMCLSCDVLIIDQKSMDSVPVNLGNSLKDLKENLSNIKHVFVKVVFEDQVDSCQQDSYVKRLFEQHDLNYCVMSFKKFSFSNLKCLLI